jgi:hypothetical protein
MWKCIKQPRSKFPAGADWDPMTLAFAMSKHERLGSMSNVPSAFDDSILRMIFEEYSTKRPDDMCTRDLLDWSCKNIF